MFQRLQSFIKFLDISSIASEFDIFPENQFSATLPKVSADSMALGRMASQKTGIPMVLPKGAFAAGGRPPVGQPSLVGEKGPELFVPSRAGTIIPNNRLGGEYVVNNIVVNVDASGTSIQGNDAEANDFGEQLAAAIQAEIINQKRSGGLLN